MESRSPEKIRLNVSGVVFVSYKKTLKTFEDSLLAKLDDSADNYDPDTKEFFFDRNPVLFNYILDAYRKGTIHLPKDTCGRDFKTELEYWGLTAKYVSPCCWGALYTSEEDMKTVRTLEDFYRGSTGIQLMTGEQQSPRTRIWLFLYEPMSSTPAMIWALFISVVIVISVLISAVESLPEVYTHRYTEEQMEGMKVLYRILGWTNGTQLDDFLYAKVNPIIPSIDCACFAFLTLEMILVAVFCPKRLNLLKSWMHWAEIILLLSFWYCFIAERCVGYMQSETLIRVYIFIKYATCLKVVRLFRVAANIPALKIMGLSMSESRNELAVMALMLFILSSFFGILIYVIEMPLPDRKFENVFSAMYWAIITLTTVGYGDYTPTSSGGHAIAGACAVCGILMLAIPIGIIASEFHTFYDHHKYAKKYITENTPWRIGLKQDKNASNENDQSQKRKGLFDYSKKM